MDREERTRQIERRLIAAEVALEDGEVEVAVRLCVKALRMLNDLVGPELGTRLEELAMDAIMACNGAQ